MHLLSDYNGKCVRWECWYHTNILCQYSTYTEMVRKEWFKFQRKLNRSLTALLLWWNSMQYYCHRLHCGCFFICLITISSSKCCIETKYKFACNSLKEECFCTMIVCFWLDLLLKITAVLYLYTLWAAMLILPHFMHKKHVDVQILMATQTTLCLPSLPSDHEYLNMTINIVLHWWAFGQLQNYSVQITEIQCLYC